MYRMRRVILQVKNGTLFSVFQAVLVTFTRSVTLLLVVDVMMAVAMVAVSVEVVKPAEEPLQHSRQAMTHNKKKVLKRLLVNVVTSMDLVLAVELTVSQKGVAAMLVVDS
jgi:hypothetical protein